MSLPRGCLGSGSRLGPGERAALGAPAAAVPGATRRSCERSDLRGWGRRRGCAGIKGRSEPPKGGLIPLAGDRAGGRAAQGPRRALAKAQAAHPGVEAECLPAPWPSGFVGALQPQASSCAELCNEPTSRADAGGTDRRDLWARLCASLQAGGRAGPSGAGWEASSREFQVPPKVWRWG